MFGPGPGGRNQHSIISKLIVGYQFGYARLTQLKFYSIKIWRGLPSYMNPRLVAINGSLKGSTFPLKEDQISIGRESASSISLSHSSVSRRHCLIERNASDFVIRDLDSFNGRCVNGVPVKEQTLMHADQIKVGSIALLFLTEDSEHLSSDRLVHLDDWNLITQSTRQVSPGVLLRQTEQALQKAEHERVARDLGALCKIGSRINLLRHTKELQHEILDSIFEIVPVDRGAILLGSEENECASRYGLDRGSES